MLFCSLCKGEVRGIFRSRKAIALWFAVLALAAVALVACGGDDEEPQAEPTATPTPAAASVAPETPPPASSAPPEETPPADDDGPSAAGQTNPRAAALGFYDAWVNGDRDLATSFATPEAIDELFMNQPGPMQFSPPCLENEDSPGYTCFFYYEGGGLNMIVGDSDFAGFFVTDIFYVAD